MLNNSLNLYYVFYITAQCGNISAAAKKLFISQPAVSKSIARLEENLQTELFLRSSRGVHLTDSGSLLYQQLDTAFHAIAVGEEQLLRSEALGMGKLSIGVSTTLCKYVLLPYLKEFIQENPLVKVTITCQSTAQTVADLEAGKLDIGLIGETHLPELLRFHPIREITDVLVTTQGYLTHLNQQAAPVGQPAFSEREQLELATLLLLDKNNVTRQYLDKYLLLHNIQASHSIEVSTMDLLIDFAKIGLGIACVIREFVEKELQDGSLVQFPLVNPIPPRQIGLAYTDSTRITPSMKKFIATMLTTSR